MTLKGILQESLEKYRDNILFHYFDQEWKTLTYHDFGEFVKNISFYLSEDEGIKKGDRVGIILENRPEWGTVYFAIVTICAIAVPIDARSSKEEVENLIKDSEAAFIFFSEKTSSLVPDGLKGMNVDSKFFYELVRSKKGRLRIFHYIDYPVSSDIASIIYTSGTTGKPKGVMLSNRNLCYDATAAIKAGIVNEKDNVLSILPLHHTYPFMCTLLVPVMIGASITYPPSLKGPEIISTIKEKGVTILVGVPQILEMIRDGILRRFNEMPFPISISLKAILKLCLYLRREGNINSGKIIFRTLHKRLGPQFRFFTSGGARLDLTVLNDLEAIGFTVLEGYGLTETSPIVTFNLPEKKRPGSVGRPIPSVEIKIINPSESGEGEIAIKGPMVMLGYYKNPEETSRVIVDGWLRTGDLGYLDDEGFLFITGRVKEVIVLSSGKNVYPEDVEKEYLRIPLIKEICVFGIENKGLIESLHALVVPDLECAKKERIANLYEAMKWEISQVTMKLPPHMRIKGFTIYTEPLPRTALGKLKRYLISDLYKSKGLKRKKGEDPEIKADELSKKVAGCIRSVIKEDTPIHLDDNLEIDIGLDSLKRLELVVSLENAFGLRLPDGFASEVITVRDLINRLSREVLKSRGSEEQKIGKAEDQKATELARKIGLYQGRLEKTLVLFLLIIVKALLKSLFRLEVKGIGNIPPHPFIIAPNHSSYIDGFVIAASLPSRSFSRLFFQGFQRYFSGRLSSFFGRLAHVIPIDPETFLGKALEVSSLLIKRGHSLCIFPEGGRTFDGEIMEFKKGIGVLSINNNVPVVPTLIEGTFNALPRGAIFPRFTKIRVIFGKPVYPSEVDFTAKPLSMDEYSFFSFRLRGEVIRLKSQLTTIK